MFSWIESEIMSISSTDYLVTLAVLAGIFLYLLYFCYNSFRRYRFVDGTATSKIRSAAQGHVELKGLGEWLPGDTIVSPFSSSRCVWYHCTIDKRKRSGKRTTWTNISDERSTHLFRLVDDTGYCIVDPDDAHVVAESDITWYGSSTADSSRAPKKASWLRAGLGLGNYRFRERLIRPATTLYALGSFRTFHSKTTDEYISRQVEEVIRQWKLQPQRYLADFDFDQNGKIQKQEWRAIHAAARKQVLAKINRESSEQHLLAKPKNSQQPFILSATPEEDLVASKKMSAYTSVACAFLIFVGLVVMTSVRPPFPV